MLFFYLYRDFRLVVWSLFVFVISNCDWLNYITWFISANNSCCLPKQMKIELKVQKFYSYIDYTLTSYHNNKKLKTFLVNYIQFPLNTSRKLTKSLVECVCLEPASLNWLASMRLLTAYLAQCTTTLRKQYFHFLSHWMGYDLGNRFPFDFEPNGIPADLKFKRKLSTRSNYIQFERK